MPDRRMPSSSTSKTFEVCGNPWNGRYDSRLTPICRGCWSEICRRDIAWGSGVEA